MKNVLVTGATGLLGSNICTELLKKGVKARTMVRTPNNDDAQKLRAAGIDVVVGEISEMKDMREAAKGVDGIIHSAAMLGRPGASMTEGFSANVLGTIHAYTVAYEMGLPMVQVLTSTFFNHLEKPLSEKSPLDLLFRNNDAYSVTKRLGFAEGLARIAEGQDIRFMLPGAIYGPSICVEKAMGRASFNERFAFAIQGKLDQLLPIPMPYVYATDCAYVAISALEKGVKGQRYVAFGRSAEMGTMAAGCNRACELAGSKFRVSEVPRDKLDDPETIKKFGPTTPYLAKLKYPTPFFDTSFTEKTFNYTPTSLDEGVTKTIAWFRENKLI